MTEQAITEHIAGSFGFTWKPSIHEDKVCYTCSQCSKRFYYPCDGFNINKRMIEHGSRNHPYMLAKEK